MHSNNAAPLEDLMAAMDVVDTLRHQQGMVDRELDQEGRRERLLNRLRDLYQAQGIEVSDQVLLQGIEALEEERFAYQSTPTSWRIRLAHIWVSRSRWTKPVGFLALLAMMFYGIYFATDVLPENRLRAELPAEIIGLNKQIEDLAEIPSVVDESRQQSQLALNAIERGELKQSVEIREQLREVLSNLEKAYKVRVVLRQGEMSALWRVSDLNESGRNYYLIVEAVDSDNEVVPLSILNEETNQQKKVKTWGLRVNEEAFLKIAADKKDDGIIQNNIVGEKKRGYLKPIFSVATTGGTISEW